MERFARMIMLNSIVLVQLAFAQSGKPQQASVQGVVVDAKGNPLAYANVYIEGTMDGAMSGEDGRFSFTIRAVGSMKLICSYIGYEPFEQEVTLRPGQALTLNITMRQKAVKGKAVTVTASAFTAADEEGVTLTAMDVVRTPGAAADVFWAIKSFPGLQQVEEGAGLFVRGGDVSETVVMLDDAIINHPYKYESPTGGFFGTFSPFLLKGTFFSSGGFSSRYGNALSGALAMESQDLPERRQIGLGVGLAAESVYLAMPVIDNKLGFSLSGNRSNTKMMFELNRTRKDFTQYPFSYDFNLNAVYRFHQNSKVKIFVFRENDKVGVEIDDPDYPTYFHGNSSNRLYNAQFTNLLWKKFLLKANVAYSDFGRDMTLGVMDLDVEDRLYQARFIGEYEWFSGFNVRAGIEFYRNHTLISGVVPENELDLSPDAPVVGVETDYVSDRAAQFFEWEMFGPFGIQIIPGVRGEYESITGSYAVDPRISLNFPLTVHSTFTAAWGIYHQFPKPEYYDPFTGNPNLSSMRASHIIFGYIYQKGQRIFRFELYHKDYRDLLLDDVVQNYMNEGNGFARGFDLFVKDAYGPVSGWLAYSWLKARRKWMNLPVQASPYFDITNNITAVLNVDVTSRLSCGLSYRYATGKPYTPAPDRIHAERVPYYQKIDFSFSYLHSFFESNSTIFYLGISNLLGRINIFDYRYSADWERRDPVESSFGRSVYFGVSFNL